MDGQDDPLTGMPSQEFADELRAAVRRRGVSLRVLQQRLRDRGVDVSVAALSQWQSGARRPAWETSADIVRELEDLLGIDEGHLARTLVPARRVAADRNLPFASFMGLELNEITDESAPRALSERSSTLMSTVDAEGRLIRNHVRNLWQAREEGAQEVAVYITIEPGEVATPEVRGVVGCELVDVLVDEEQRVIRPIVRLDAPLRRGQVALAEWESFDHRYADDVVSGEQMLVAVRHEVEVGVFVYFDPALLPRRCWATVAEGDRERAFPVPLIGTCASHVEFDFGPGSIRIDWEW
ncbi:hypothetical protein [Microbacterium sp. NPDC089695]|uniref:hypothetical protein n=1 Tax=Microbacterium sp. NPDC089695 TaxID=3364198 RepID=UPI00381905E6